MALKTFHFGDYFRFHSRPHHHNSWVRHQIRKGEFFDNSGFRFPKSEPNEKVEQEHLPIWLLQMGIDPNKKMIYPNPSFYL
jgi:hypothetical protein